MISTSRTLTLSKPMLLETGERTADRFQLQAEIAADLLPCHAQLEGVRGIAARAEALRQVEQESRQAFFGAHRTEQHHDAMVAHDLAAHDLVQVTLQAGQFAAQLFQPVEWDFADFAVFQCHGIAGVGVGADRVQPDDLAGHLEAGHLFAPVLMQHLGLEETGADGIQRTERLAAAVQIFAATKGALEAGQCIKPLHLVPVQIDGKAELAQIAA